jgi:hypothetical protein
MIVQGFTKGEEAEGNEGSTIDRVRRLPANIRTTRCLSVVFAVALDWLFEGVGTIRRSA